MVQLELDFGPEERAQQAVAIIEKMKQSPNPDIRVKKRGENVYVLWERIFEGPEVEWNFLCHVDPETFEILRKNLNISVS